MTIAAPLSVLAAYGFSSASTATPVPVGLINQTFYVEEGGRRAALQRLHPIFHASVHLDIEAITAHLAPRGVLTPRLMRTLAGELWTHDQEGAVWRMMSWLEGTTVSRVESPAMARTAAQLVGRFHEAVRDLRHAFHFSRPGAHDTPLHLQKLERALAAHVGHREYARVRPLADAILRHAERLEPMPPMPPRIIHGDLKISNLLFNPAGDTAIALLDLDTMAELTIPIELGDALRSWCNPAGEDAAQAEVRVELFEAALEGYGPAVREFLEPVERAHLVCGLETIALELAARFCADALEESYFGWNRAAYASASEHNLVRAKSQLAVAESARAQRAALERIVVRALSGSSR